MKMIPIPISFNAIVPCGRLISFFNSQKILKLTVQTASQAKDSKYLTSEYLRNLL